MIQPEMEKHHPKALPLKDLSAFESAPVPLGTELGELLEVTPSELVILCHPDNYVAALIYQQLIGRENDRSRVVLYDDPVAQAQGITEQGIVPIVVTRATDADLKEMMFRNFSFGQLLADSFPVPNWETPGASPILHCIGITRHGIRVLNNSVDFSHSRNEAEAMEALRSQRITNILRDIITPTDFRAILRSPQLEKVVVHALGPKGTNICQAAVLYIARLGIENKAHVVIHDAGITPMEYAQIASEETHRLFAEGERPRKLHLHMECAVYNDMGTLYDQRKKETVFADTQDMALDNMQLAAQATIDDLRALVDTRGNIRVATHPSPRSLVLPWLERGVATWVQASSNSAAARMVTNSEADACVTTASTVRLLNDHGKTMRVFHEFGSPNMIFTVASPMTRDKLSLYLDAIGKNL